MKQCNTCKVEKDVTEFYVWGGKLSGICKPCNRAKTSKWQQANKDRYAQRQTRYRELNSEKLADYYSGYYENNKQGILENRKSWKKANADKVYKACAKRRATKTKSVPKMNTEDSEFNTFVMEEAYSLASVRKALTGTDWHVDHKVPLNSDRVCGLHWYHNIAVIPAKENLRKSNSQWEHKW